MSSKANADVMNPDKRIAATRITSDFPNIVNKGRVKKVKIASEMKVIKDERL